jgi:hypothetical protein
MYLKQDKSSVCASFPSRINYRLLGHSPPLCVIRLSKQNKEQSPYLNVELKFATHHYITMAKVLKKELYQNLSKNIHISWWKQLCEPTVHWKHHNSGLASAIIDQFRGWLNAAQQSIPPNVSEDPVEPEYERDGPLAVFFNSVSGLTYLLRVVVTCSLI